MRIGIPRETATGETRVAATPKTVSELIKLGYEVILEAGAGVAASFPDEEYQTAGATVAEGDAVWASGLIFKVNPPNDAEIERMQPETILISFMQPAQHPKQLEMLQQKKITVLAMDMVPRISRAQSMDALSSMANISGYRAVIEAAEHFGRFFTGQITAAGKVPPAEVLVIGAGVAGLAAIGTCRQLGAVVSAFDTRPEVADQIESMGGQFLTLDIPQENSDGGDGYAKTMSEDYLKAEMQLFADQARKVDIIITTAAIPGQPAPKLITKAMVDSMKAGSVIVDLAAATGGNCAYTKKGKVFVTPNGVKVIGYTDMANRLAAQASQLYGTNLVNLAKLLTPQKDGQVDLNLDDVVIRNMTLTHNGECLYPPPPVQVSARPAAKPPAAVSSPQPADTMATQISQSSAPYKKILPLVIAALLVLWAGAVAPVAFLRHFMVFVLACVVGYYVVWRVTASLHTPLMAVTNAISGIIVVGALLQIGQGHGFVSLLAFIAIAIASVNIFGGFYVTRRMLNLFHK
ncbi:Re/Si-specific NAD(P)(+) transhydrogenase subunit alpha [Neisseriaceae bacterium ESL0693]|nr:Re/Si-specific NAD(P)(+) transhydrogenase subunit alpha [Neisseriaceae bacterium ESL0693]